MLKEFKDFALKGNMLDMAIGIIIGGAFSGLVNSLVENIIMPFLSIFTSRIDFTNLFIALDGNQYNSLQEAQDAGVATLNYGTFLSGFINFIIMAFIVFLIVKWINKLRKPEPVAEPTIKECPYCYTEVHLDAIKCPNCTSNLSEYDDLTDTQPSV